MRISLSGKETEPLDEKKNYTNFEKGKITSYENIQINKK